MTQCVYAVSVMQCHAEYKIKGGHWPFSMHFSKMADQKLMSSRTHSMAKQIHTDMTKWPTNSDTLFCTLVCIICTCTLVFQPPPFNPPPNHKCRTCVAFTCSATRMHACKLLHCISACTHVCSKHNGISSTHTCTHTHTHTHAHTQKH